MQHKMMKFPGMAFEGNFHDFLMAADAAIDYVSSLNVCNFLRQFSENRKRKLGIVILGVEQKFNKKTKCK